MTTGNKAPVTAWLLQATGLKCIKNIHVFRAKTSVLHCRAGSVPGAGGWIFCKGSRFSQPLQSSSSGSLSSLQERLQGLSADTSSLLVFMKIYHTFFQPVFTGYIVACLYCGQAFSSWLALGTQVQKPSSPTAIRLYPPYTPQGHPTFG